jgi:hypothetical protein
VKVGGERGSSHEIPNSEDSRQLIRGAGRALYWCSVVS